MLVESHYDVPQFMSPFFCSQNPPAPRFNGGLEMSRRLLFLEEGRLGLCPSCCGVLGGGRACPCCGSAAWLGSVLGSLLPRWCASLLGWGPCLAVWLLGSSAGLPSCGPAGPPSPPLLLLRRSSPIAGAQIATDWCGGWSFALHAGTTCCLLNRSWAKLTSDQFVAKADRSA